MEPSFTGHGQEALLCPMTRLLVTFSGSQHSRTGGRASSNPAGEGGRETDDGKREAAE